MNSQKEEAWVEVYNLLRDKVPELMNKPSCIEDAVHVINTLVDESGRGKQYPNPPHKHRDLIIAWANGAEIEWYSVIASCWLYLKNPSWCETTQYRIKPTKSAKDIEIEQIQAEMDKLKERLEKVFCHTLGHKPRNNCKSILPCLLWILRVI